MCFSFLIIYFSLNSFYEYIAYKIFFFVEIGKELTCNHLQDRMYNEKRATTEICTKASISPPSCMAKRKYTSKNDLKFKIFFGLISFYTGDESIKKTINTNVKKISSTKISMDATNIDIGILFTFSNFHL